MRAMAFTDFGADLEAADLSVPEPGPGEVLVRVLASSVNGFDLGVLGGHLKGMLDYEFPVVLGKDFAGLHYMPNKPGRDIKATAVMANPNLATLARLAADAAEGRLRVPVARSYPLAEAPRAIGDFTAGTVGKLAVTI